MNILLNINKSYLSVASVLIYSIIYNNIETNINFYIFHTDIGEENKSNFISIFKKFKNINIVFYKIDESIEQFEAVNKIGSNRWPKMVYYRLLAPYILDNNLDRILYLDADMIVDGSLKELYSMDFGNNMVAMCEDTFVTDKVSYNENLDIPNFFVYYNSGMVLMNLKLIREKINREEIYSIFNKYYENLLFPDQDILNILFHDKCINVDYRKYNFICSYQRESSQMLRLHSQNAIIYHFAGGKYHKPWETNYLGEFFDIYWKYAIFIFGEKKKKKYFYLTKILKPYNILQKRIDLFLDFHFRK